MKKHPRSPWAAALLTGLGLEYHNTAHYSLALDAWEKAWPLAKAATDLKGKAIADRAAGELASIYARLGRMGELEALLRSVEGRAFVGAATEKIAGAREGLWSMQHQPEISFKCGAYALQQILLSDQKLRTSSLTNAGAEIAKAASTTQGFSLPQVAELSMKIGLNYQMAFREASKAESKKQKAEGDFIVPSVVHWKVGHYAAMVLQEGDRYLLEDPTFRNTVWATKQALEAETSGYFLIPPGDLPRGWRSVDVQEGASIWGRGTDHGPTPDANRCKDPKKPNHCNKKRCPKGMAVADAHLMLVSLNIVDEPVGYAPPVGPPVNFVVTYNQREANQPANFTYSNFGPKWTCDWISYITDNPQSTSADVKYFAQGGGTRTFNGFSTNAQSFAFQQYDQTLLRRTGTNSYELTSPDGSKLVFSQPDGSIGTSRKIFLTQILDPFGNAVTLAYDGNLRLVGITDAIGQVTTLTYGNTNDLYRITRVTDPFGRFADFAYDSLGRLTNITDVIGLNSGFIYSGSGDFISQLITPYGTNTFITAQGGGPNGTTRSLETVYPDGSRDRVEYNQSENLGIPANDPPAIVPVRMNTFNLFLHARNTYYWSRTACASSYGDYTRAKIYHWLHTENLAIRAGILESTKEALEGRAWYNYPGQTGLVGAGGVGTSSRPTKVGRVLDDGSTQLYTYDYNGFGNLTNSVDPLGRTFSYIYDTNGIDLLEIRQTRAGNNELLSKATYNAQHLPLTTTDAAGQTTTNTYNARGQLLTTSNPKGETTTYTYNTNGYLIAVDGPLPGTNDTVTLTYDPFGRMLVKTDTDGYTITFGHDALDRMTNITFPDATFYQITYNRLEPSVLQDRAGRQTFLEYDALGNLAKRTDPLGRVTQFQWCNCGSVKSLTDPMGRTTEWQMDVQGRPSAKQYGDGSKVSYLYENASGRLRQVIDEKLQVKQFTCNRDNSLRSVSYLNTTVPTPTVTYAYDPDYERITSMIDGTGTNLYSYVPIAVTPSLGAGKLTSVDGPLPNDTITYGYDELGRRVTTAIDGVASLMTYDAAGRVVGETNALGAFTYAYDGTSGRLVSEIFPNGQTRTNSYDDNLHDRALQRITHKVGNTPLSEFIYGRDIAADRITTWSHQAGASAPDLYTFGYDAADQLLSATVTNTGSLINTFAYNYDPAGNRLREVVAAATNVATYNALNQISTTTAPGSSRTNEWNGEDQLTAINSGNQRTEFAYDGLKRLMNIRHLTNGVEASLRRFLWCDSKICEERNASGAVTKRFFAQAMKVEAGPTAGSYYYACDHLGSIRELTDSSGNVRARYAYDPYGRPTKLTGDLDSDFGFAGMFWSREAALSLTKYRAYDPELGRWLSRDPLRNAEQVEGPNLFVYVRNDPVNATDPLGLGSCCLDEYYEWKRPDYNCNDIFKQLDEDCATYKKVFPNTWREMCDYKTAAANQACDERTRKAYHDANRAWAECESRPCAPECEESLPKPRPCYNTICIVKRKPDGTYTLEPP